MLPSCDRRVQQKSRGPMSSQRSRSASADLPRGGRSVRFAPKLTKLPSRPVGWKDDAMKILIKLVVTALAVWVATVLVPGIHLHAHTTAGKITTLIVVALI